MTRDVLGPADYRVEDRGFVTPCWIRAGRLHRSGYSRVTIAGRTTYAHRTMYEQAVGPIRDGMTIDHLCGQRACIRPEHLEAVPIAENCRRGSKTKLTWDDIQAIRQSQQPIRQLAAQYDISIAHAYMIRNGQRWAAA
jgi:hypothetical protein